MKNHNTSAFKAPSLLMGFILIFTLSCKKDSTTSTTPTSSASGAFTYKADGVAAVADSAYAVLYGPKASRAMDIYSRTGKKEGMEFHFSPKTGAQTVGSLTGGGVLLTYYDTNGIEYDSQSGTFNLSACDTLNKNIVGDFAFSGKMQAPGTGTKSVTEGHFVVTKIYHQ